MFRIYDGREEFYQWDLDRKLIVEDASVNQVHYCNRTSDCSLVCEVRTEGNLRVVDVPNIILQTDWKVHAYAYDTNYTKHEELFNIVKRTKPEDYVYTETEVLNYNTLLERIDEIDENIGQVVEDYLKENPIEVDLSGYATKKDLETIELTPGPKGDPGEPGKNGEPGEDGKTPVKGTDYWTEADKAEIVEDVLAEMPEPEAADVDFTSCGFVNGAFAKALVMNDLGNSFTADSSMSNDEILEAIEKGQVLKWGMTDTYTLTFKEPCTLTYFIGDKVYRETNATTTNLKPGQNIVVKLGYNNYVKGTTAQIQKYFQGLYYDNSTSGLTAKTLPGAIDELKTLVDNAGGGGADLSNYYTKTEVDNLITSAIGEVENGSY